MKNTIIVYQAGNLSFCQYLHMNIFTVVQDLNTIFIRTGKGKNYKDSGVFSDSPVHYPGILIFKIWDIAWVIGRAYLSYDLSFKKWHLVRCKRSIFLCWECGIYIFVILLVVKWKKLFYCQDKIRWNSFNVMKNSFDQFRENVNSSSHCCKSENVSHERYIFGMQPNKQIKIMLVWIVVCYISGFSDRCPVAHYTGSYLVVLEQKLQNGRHQNIIAFLVKE